MSWNKTAIASTASPNHMAKTVGLKEHLGHSRRLQAARNSSGQVEIFSKRFPATQFLAIAENQKAREDIRQERQRFKAVISGKVDKEYGAGTVEAIQNRRNNKT